MKVYRKVNQTKFKKDGLEGLLTMHDNGNLAVSRDLKVLFTGLQYFESNSYFCIDKPTVKQTRIIMDRLFDFKSA